MFLVFTPYVKLRMKNAEIAYKNSRKFIVSFGSMHVTMCYFIDFSQSLHKLAPQHVLISVMKSGGFFCIGLVFYL